jgi:hypothetical protein
VFSQKPILGIDNYKAIKELIYRFDKMESLLEEMIASYNKGNLQWDDKEHFMYTTFRHLYGWSAFQAHMIAYLMLIISYHNEELVKSTIPSDDIKKYKRQVQNLSGKQKQFFKNVTMHRPLDGDPLRTWIERALDDSKKEPVF